MSLLGTAWNKTLGKPINVLPASSGPGYIRLSEAIEQEHKTGALDKTKAAFESEKLFKKEDMKEMHQLTIKHVYLPQVLP